MSSCTYECMRNLEEELRRKRAEKRALLLAKACYQAVEEGRKIKLDLEKLEFKVHGKKEATHP